MQGPAWYAPLGLFASADAISAGFTTAAERDVIVSSRMNDSVTVCGLSNFNVYFVLQVGGWGGGRGVTLGGSSLSPPLSHPPLSPPQLPLSPPPPPTPPRAPPSAQALSTAGDLDRGYAVVHRCWDVVIALGGTTVWEVSKPDWPAFLAPNDAVPGFEDGFTSLAHPWSR